VISDVYPIGKFGCNGNGWVVTRSGRAPHWMLFT
jgi:hypothetical protein